MSFKLKSISALDGLAADAALGTNPKDPRAFADHCLYLIAGMVCDDRGNAKYTLDEAKQLPDFLVSEMATSCLEKRAADQVESKKKLEANSEQSPIRSLSVAAKKTSTDSSPECPSGSSSNGRHTSPESDSSEDQTATEQPAEVS